MTFSICARDGDRHGVGVATKAIAVGSTAPFVSRYGAVCTQAMTNTPLGVNTIRALENDETIDVAINRLLECDEHASARQIHGVDAQGNQRGVTGEDCVPWAGQVIGEDYTIAGNMLEGESVLESMETAFLEQNDLSLDQRILKALRAGSDAGGDKRREHPQSSALCVFAPQEPRLAHDLRVDEHEDAITELERVHALATEVGAEWVTQYPQANIQRHPKPSESE